jgi:hypothetical protein
MAPGAAGSAAGSAGVEVGHTAGSSQVAVDSWGLKQRRR